MATSLKNAPMAEDLPNDHDDHIEAEPKGLDMNDLREARDAIFGDRTGIPHEEYLENWHLHTKDFQRHSKTMLVQETSTTRGVWCPSWARCTQNYDALCPRELIAPGGR